MQELPEGVELIKTHCIASTEDCTRNIVSAYARKLPECTKQPFRTGRLAIVGSAPSVSDYLDEIKACDEIWAVNGSYDWLLSQGIVPHGFLGMDPVPGLAEYVEGARKETTFYISSVCDPSVFDALEGFRVVVWHTKQEALCYPDDAVVLCGGSTCLTRAPFLANLLGWRDIHVFGCDSSYAEDRYVYPSGTYQEDQKRPVIWIEVDGHAFPTVMGLAQQATQFCVIHEMFKGQLKFRCGGLTAALLASPICDEEQIFKGLSDGTPAAA